MKIEFITTTLILSLSFSLGVGVILAAPLPQYPLTPYFSGHGPGFGYLAPAAPPHLPYSGAPGTFHPAPVPYNYQPVPPVPAHLPYTTVAAIEHYDPHPQYNYGYSVSDAITGDSKSHTETRNGDNVSGQYSLIEPDGSLRVVTYTADAINGFNAVVDRKGPTIHSATTAASVPFIAHSPGSLVYAHPATAAYY